MVITCKNSKGESLEIETLTEEFLFSNNRGKCHLLIYDDNNQEFFMACDTTFTMKAPNKSVNFFIPISNIEGEFGFPKKEHFDDIPDSTSLKGKICGNCLKKKKYIKVLNRSGGKTTTEVKKQKLQNKLNKMADPGYYVEYLIDDHGNKKNVGNSDRASVICISKDGKAQYFHWEWGTEWCTLQWNCAPTRKQVEKASKIKKAKQGNLSARKYEYYSTWDDFVNNCTTKVHPNSKKVKAPNDV